MKYFETAQLPENSELVKRLPADIAFRYHVLPLAEENECITVAMADPEDVNARKEISAFFGHPIFVIQSEREKIDARLQEIWSGKKGIKKYSALVLREKVSKSGNGHQSGLDLNGFRSFSGKFCELIEARITQLEIPSKSKNVLRNYRKTITDGDYDLVIVNRSHQDFLHSMMSSVPTSALSLQINTSLMVVRNPRWPIRQILLILRFNPIDEVAVNWAAHMAQLCDAAVTILPITPLFPAMYQHALNEMLAAESQTGRKFHEYIQRFVDLKIPHLIHHHHDVPNLQIKAEIWSRQYDLVVIGAESEGWLLRWFAGDLVKPLLSSAKCPIVITKCSLGHMEHKYEVSESFYVSSRNRMW